MLKHYLQKRLARRSILKDDSAATAVEFAMVAPVFFLVLGAIIETGLMLFTEYVLQSSVQEAAREIRTGQAQSAGLTSAAFKTKICDMASIIMDCEGGVTVYVRSDSDFATLQTAVPSYLEVGATYGGIGGSTSYDCGTPSEAVAIIATYDWNFMMLGMSAFGNIDGDSKRRLAGFAMFRNEPFPAGTNCGA